MRGSKGGRPEDLPGTRTKTVPPLTRLRYDGFKDRTLV